MSYRLYQNPHNEPQAALFLEVEVVSRKTNQSILTQMKIDTGSARSVLPLALINDSLNLDKPFSHTPCTSYEGLTHQQPLFFLDFKIDGNTFIEIEIIGISKNTSYGLIGRDILSKCFLRCDGPNQKFELEYIPT